MTTTFVPRLNFLILLTDSWKRIFDKSYQVQKAATNRSEAVSACEKFNGKLFEPKTAMENVDVLKLLRDVDIMRNHNIVWNYEAVGNCSKLENKGRELKISKNMT